MIGVNVTFVLNQIMSPDLQGMYNSYKLKVMSRVALFMVFQLSRGISYDFPLLHQNTTKSLPGCITVDYKVLPDVW